jgi:hypothetical protein
VEDGLVRAGGRKDSSWWKDVYSFREGVELSIRRWSEKLILVGMWIIGITLFMER